MIILGGNMMDNGFEDGQAASDMMASSQQRKKRAREFLSTLGDLIFAKIENVEVLTNGIEVKLQRNALSVIEPPTGLEEDDDLEFENTIWHGSDMASDDTQKSYRSLGSSHRSMSRSFSVDSQSKGSISMPQGWTAFAQLLRAPQDYSQAIIRDQFPVPRLVVCAQHGSQARFLLAKLNPSATNAYKLLRTEIKKQMSTMDKVFSKLFIFTLFNYIVVICSDCDFKWKFLSHMRYVSITWLFERKAEIKIGDGLPVIRLTTKCLEALKQAGFEVIWEKDLASDSPLPWYLPRDKSHFSLSSFCLTGSVGRLFTRNMV